MHRELGDLLSKTNRPTDACVEYEKALNSGITDSDTKEKVFLDSIALKVSSFSPLDDPSDERFSDPTVRVQCGIRK